MSEEIQVRRLFCFLYFALAAAASTAVPAIAQDSLPTILLVLFDDVGFTDVSAYGGFARTPNIDALARQGTKFSRFYSSPFCGPSRAMLMTGMDNHQVGMGTLVETVTPEIQKHPGYSMKWKVDQKTLASRLSKAGYQAYSEMVGVFELGPEDFAHKQLVKHIARNLSRNTGPTSSSLRLALPP